MSCLIYIINGPNLNLLGKREPDIYGTTTLEDVENICLEIAKKNNIKLKFLQSNAEHEIINWIHNAREDASGIIINPAAYSHTSIAILDALTLFEEPIIEVHISNIHKRESFRHHSYISQKSSAVIAGFGIDGYKIALKKLIDLCSN
ncbi:MAG: type II 3-dehydroquinate dehydratase [Paracoccaceae bacterium]|tara:strand:- start:383 stop:823 length:441 start_codon:yes stop_codon:yes gene_type:complete